MFRKSKQAPRCSGGVRTTVGICMVVLVALAVTVYGSAIAYTLRGEEGKGTEILNAQSPATTVAFETNSNINSNTQTQTPKQSISKPVFIFYVGNSIIQVNNTPRFMQYLRNTAQGESAIRWRAFLRGGQTLYTLVKQGMRFGHIQNLDYVVMNDQSQYPARTYNRNIVVQSMIKDYAPMFQASGAIPVFIVTAAYRNKVKGSADLGSVEQFTNLLVQGYQRHKNLFWYPWVWPIYKCTRKIQTFGGNYLRGIVIIHRHRERSCSAVSCTVRSLENCRPRMWRYRKRTMRCTNCGGD
jgi:hypothetical protein